MTDFPDITSANYFGTVPEGNTVGTLKKGGFARHPSYIQSGPDGKQIPGTEIGGEFNYGNIGSAISGGSSLLSIIQGIRQNRLAKEQLGFNKQAYYGNVTRQNNEYNRNLADITEARKALGGNKSQADAYFDNYKL